MDATKEAVLKSLDAQRAHVLGSLEGLDGGPLRILAAARPACRTPHVITETACRAGHLDAARELIDGTTWLILE